MSLAFALSPDASAQYRWGDCLRVTRLSDRPDDSVLVISVEDTCLRRIDTIHVAGGKISKDFAIEADSGIVATFLAGEDYWQSTFRLVPADTLYFLGITFYVGEDTIWTHEKVVVPDTLRLTRGPIFWNEIIGKPLSAAYFFHEEDPGIPGHESLLPEPADDPSHLHVTSVTAGPSTLIHSFATESLPASIIQPGRWDFHLYASVNITSQSSHLEVEILRRDTAGTEVSLFTAISPDINNTAIGEVEWQAYTSSEFPFEEGERLVAKVYAFTTSVASVDVSWAYEGDSASHFEVPFFTSTPDANDTLFTQLRDTPDSYSGHGGKLVAVKMTEDGLEFVSPSSGGGSQILGYSNVRTAAVTDSAAPYVWLTADIGLALSHYYDPTRDTIVYIFSPDWQVHKDSVMAWIAAYHDTAASGGGGATTFLELTDTPASYAGKAGQVPIVNPGETALEFGVMPVSGALTNATIVWDTVGIAVDSSCTIYRMEWMPPITAYPLSEPSHPDYVGAHQRIGYVRYRLYVNPPETWRSAAGYYSYLLHFVADSANGAMLLTGRLSAMSWNKGPGSSIQDETWSLYTIPGGTPGSYSTGTQYGYATTSSYRAIRTRMAWYSPMGDKYTDPTTGMTGKHQMWQWMTSAHSSSTSLIFGVVDIHLYYVQAHGYNSTYGAKITRVLYRPMTSDGVLPEELK